MFKLNYLGALVLAVTSVLGTSMVSCSDDDKDDSDVPTPEVKGEMTPAQAKAYLEETATMFLNKFNPSDQAKVVDFAQYVVDEYGDLEAPTEWDLDDEPWYGPARVMQAVAEVCNGNFYAMSRAVSDEYDFERFAGVYTPGNYRWIKDGKSSDVVFRFKNANGADCEVKITGSANESSMIVDDVAISVPKNLVLTVKEGGTTHANITITSAISEIGHNAFVKVDGTVANIHVVSELKATDSSINEVATVEVSGSQIVKANATINGNNMCNRSVIERYIRNEDVDALVDLMTNATAEVDVIGRLQLKGSAREFNKLKDVLDTYYDNYEYGSQASAETACKRDCDVLKSNVKVGMYYNSSTKQGDLGFQANFYSSYGWWEWYIDPVIVFCADRTSYSFEEYFGNSRFASVTNLWESLIDNYERLWN